MKLHNYLSINIIALVGFWDFICFLFGIISDELFYKYEQLFLVKTDYFLYKFCYILTFLLPILMVLFFIEFLLEKKVNTSHKIIFKSKLTNIIHKVFVHINVVFAILNFTIFATTSLFF